MTVKNDYAIPDHGVCAHLPSKYRMTASASDRPIQVLKATKTDSFFWVLDVDMDPCK
jgi:hypothetical protein